MRVAVVHYHYRPGGVTRVVENAFESFQGRDIAAVAICGEPYSGGKMPVRLQPGLRYSQANEKISPGPLWYALKMIARQALGGVPDLWHFHNPALGKNSAMAEVVGKMAAETPVLLQFHDFAEDGRPANYAMLRERMENIARLYPQAAQVHYATTNARDRAFLCASGFNPANVHLLPNPVWVQDSSETACTADTDADVEGHSPSDSRTSPSDSRIDPTDLRISSSELQISPSNLRTHSPDSGAHSPDSGTSLSGLPVNSSNLRTPLADSTTGDCPDLRGALAGLDRLEQGQALYLYPTRGIRRKNLGEFLLWAALSAGEADAPLFATTLEPENPLARQVYGRWLAFADELGLPVAFGVGQGRNAPSFTALMQRSQAVVTTSVAEGFGMAFLEPWLFGKPVLGRNLPEITADFVAQGLNLSGLYDRLLVPESLIDMQALRDKLAAAMKHVYAAYQRTVPADAVEVCLRAAGDGQGRIDFGCLDEPLQEQVIAALVSSPQLRGQLLPSALDAPHSTLANAEKTAADLGSHAMEAGSQALIATNAQTVQQHYGIARYGERLETLYRQVADSPRTRFDYADPALILDKFLAPERFRLLCS